MNLHFNLIKVRATKNQFDLYFSFNLVICEAMNITTDFDAVDKKIHDLKSEAESWKDYAKPLLIFSLGIQTVRTINEL